MSTELKEFLYNKNIATSRTTSYNPTGNGQVERYNGIIWKTITLALKTQQLPAKYWQEVLRAALHSIRSLLCTATNSTPYERLFNFQRRSTGGQSIPSWLTTPGPVLLKRHVRNSTFEPLVDGVELIEANPYAHVKLPNGKEGTVSLKHLAHCNSEVRGESDFTGSMKELVTANDPMQGDGTESDPMEGLHENGTEEATQNEAPLRPSQRIRRLPDRLGY